MNEGNLLLITNKEKRKEKFNNTVKSFRNKLGPIY